MRRASKLEAKYRPWPNKADGKHERCDVCTMFVRPDGCTAVIGEVIPVGWCEYFAARKAASPFAKSE